MDFIIKPYEGVEVPGKGVIRFDMTSEEVRRFFDEEPVNDTVHSTDGDYFYQAYRESSVMFGFDLRGSLYRIDLGGPSSRVFVGSERIDNLIYKDLIESLMKKHPIVRVPSEGCKCPSLGLVVWAEGPLLDIQEEYPEGLILYRRGAKELGS